jgi:hypothetical protein
VLGVAAVPGVLLLLIARPGDLRGSCLCCEGR